MSSKLVQLALPEQVVDGLVALLNAASAAFDAAADEAGTTEDTVECEALARQAELAALVLATAVENAKKR